MAQVRVFFVGPRPLVKAEVPRAKVAFDTSPGNAAEAVQRRFPRSDRSEVQPYTSR